MKNIVAIAIPVLLTVLLLFGLGGRGYEALALLLLLVGGYCLFWPVTKKNILYATLYVVGLEFVFFLFS